MNKTTAPRTETSTSHPVLMTCCGTRHETVAASLEHTCPSEPLVHAVQVTITNDDGDGVDLTVFQARTVLRAALGARMVGDWISTSGFDGDYLIDLTPEFWAEVVGAGEWARNFGIYDLTIHATAW